MKPLLALVLPVFSLVLPVSAAPHQVWPEEKANKWYAKEPWLVGSNYIPANAINQLEMWQADSFDPQRIDLELGWAEGLGMNTIASFSPRSSLATGRRGLPRPD